MIIFGSRTWTSRAGAGSFTCPNCTTPQPFQQLAQRRWFTLYFIPLFPLGAADSLTECQRCFSRFAPSEDDGGSPFARQASAEGAGASQSDWQAGGSQPAGPAKTSGLAITSFIFALLSPGVICLCGLSVLTSLTAVVTGHVALAGIKRSGGRLAGRGMALTGVIGGYLMLAASIGGIAWFVTALRDDAEHNEHVAAQGDDAVDADDRLRRAEMRVLTPDDNGEGAATGNSQQAQALAERYSEALARLRESLFTAGKEGGVSLSGGQFVTHCELHEGQCAFIVHVPQYRNFEDDAKQSLATVAWAAAEHVAADALEPGDRLAVALRGVLLYGAVLVGELPAPGGQEGVYSEGEREDLLAFFPAAINEYEELVDESFEMPPAHGPDQMLPPASVDPVVAPSAIAPADAPSNRPRNAQSPAAGAANASRQPNSTPPSPDDGVPTLNDVVRQFPDMGWPVKSLAFAPHKNWIAVGKLDGTLVLFDVDSGRTLSEQKGLNDMGAISCIAFSLDGKLLFSAGSLRSVLVWSVADDGGMELAQTLSGQNGGVDSLAVNSTDRFVVTGGRRGELTWQRFGGEATAYRTMNVLSRQVQAIFQPSSDQNALATDGNELVSLDLQTATVHWKRPVTRGGIRAAAFSRDGSRIAVISWSGIEVWETATGTALKTFDTMADGQWTLSFLNGGDRLVSGGNGEVKLWDLAQDEAVGRFDLGAVHAIQTLAVSSDSSLLAAIPASSGQTLTVFRIPQ